MLEVVFIVRRNWGVYFLVNDLKYMYEVVKSEIFIEEVLVGLYEVFDYYVFKYSSDIIWVFVYIK